MKKPVYFLLLLTLITSCKDDDSNVAVEESLYSRIGGSDAITTLVNRTITNISTHQTLASHFSVALGDPNEAARLTNSLIVYFTDVTGGPLTYSAFSDMQKAHSMASNENINTAITASDFDAFISVVTEEATALNVPEAELNEVAAILNANKIAIVNAN